MRSNKILENVTVLNKVDNQRYKIIKVVDGVGTAALINPEDESLDETKTVTITPDNAIAYRLINNPNLPEVPSGYSVKGGILMRDLEQVTQQGEIVIDKIIAVVPGKLLLAVVPRESKDGYIDLFSYIPEEDKFKKLIRRSIPMPEVIGTDKEYVFLKSCRIRTEEYEGDNKEKLTRELLEFSELIAYDGARDYIASYITFDTPIENIIPVRNSENISAWVIESSKTLKDCDCDNEDEDEDTDYDEDEADEDCGNCRNCRNTCEHCNTYETALEDLNGEYVATMIGFSGCSFMRMNTIRIPSHVKSVSIGYKKADLIRLEDRIMIGGYADKIITAANIISAIDGYNWIVDTTTEDNELRISLANDNMDVKTIVVKSTRDRGDVISLA